MRKPIRVPAIAANALLIAAALNSGCTLPKAERSLGDSDPTAKIPAIKLSANEKNTKSIPQLVEDLDSDDPAIRFYSIRALKDLTGETFGYRYFDDELERRDAVVAWQRWLTKEMGIPLPGGPPSTAPGLPAPTTRAGGD